MNTRKGFFALLSMGFLYGSFGIFVRLLNNNFTTFQQIFLRNSTALLFVIGILYLLKTKFSLHNTSKKYLFLYCISSPLAIVFFTLSVLYTKISIATFSLYSGSILMSMVLGSFIFSEKITARKILAICLLLFGLFCFCIPFSHNLFNRGVLFGLLSGFCDAITYSFKKYLSQKIHIFILSSLELLSGMLMSWTTILLMNETFSFSQFSPGIFVISIFFGGIAACLSYVSLIGFKNFDLQLGTLLTSSEIVFATLFAALLFHEIPTHIEFTGIVSIAIAICIAQVDMQKWEAALQKIPQLFFKQLFH